MRCGVVFLALCIGYVSAEKKILYPDPDKMVQILPFIFQCADETKVPPEVLADYRAGVISSSDKNVSKFRYCLFYKSGYVDKNGHLKVDKAVDFFPNSDDKKNLRKVLEECSKEEGGDSAETVTKFVKCFTEKNDYIVKL